MEDGMYVRKVLTIEILERSDEDVIVSIVDNDDRNHAINKYGESARALVLTLLDQLDQLDK